MTKRIDRSSGNHPGRNHSRQSGKIGMGCLITVLIVVALAAGGGYLAYNKFRDMMAEQLLAAVKDDPAIKEHLGEVQSFEVDMAATGLQTEAVKKAGKLPKDHTVFVFQIVGSKGKGSVAVTMGPEDVAAAMDSSHEGGATFAGATLTMAGGQVYELKPKPGAPVSVPGDSPVEKPPEEKPAEAPAKTEPAPTTK